MWFTKLGQKKIGPETFWVKNYLKLCQNNFWVQKNFGPNKFGSKKTLGQTNIWSNKFWIQRKFWVHKNCWSTKALPSKPFGSKKNLYPKNISSKEIYFLINFGSRWILGEKKISVLPKFCRIKIVSKTIFHPKKLVPKSSV